MANATALTVTELVENGNIAQPTADTLDTGSAAVTISADVGGVACRVILEVTNTAAANLVAEVQAGDKPPASRSGLGALSSGNIAQNGVKIMGPFDASRFIQDDGKLDVKFTPASGTIAASIRCYKLPKL
jgi:hypothetical protein